MPERRKQTAELKRVVWHALSPRRAGSGRREQDLIETCILPKRLPDRSMTFMPIQFVAACVRDRPNTNGPALDSICRTLSTRICHGFVALIRSSFTARKFESKLHKTLAEPVSHFARPIQMAQADQLRAVCKMTSIPTLPPRRHSFAVTSCAWWMSQFCVVPDTRPLK